MAQALLAKNNQFLTSLEDMLDRWSGYFGELLNVDQAFGGQTDDCKHVVGENRQWVTVGFREVVDAVASLKNGKAAGFDEITSEMVNHSGIADNVWLHRIIKVAWETGLVQGDWQKSVIVPIYKKGNKKEYCNYMGISLLSVPGKVYTNIMNKRLRNVVESKLSEFQSGFSSGRGCQDNILVLR